MVKADPGGGDAVSDTEGLCGSPLGSVLAHFSLVDLLSVKFCQLLGEHFSDKLRDTIPLNLLN